MELGDFGALLREDLGLRAHGRFGLGHGDVGPLLDLLLGQHDHLAALVVRAAESTETRVFLSFENTRVGA